MRCRWLLRPTMLAGALLPASGGFAAETYPWCMIYQDMTGATACYYKSYDECRMSAAGGNGGLCLQNPAYREPQSPAPGPARKARRAR
jgi:hypothetical protein